MNDLPLQVVGELVRQAREAEHNDDERGHLWRLADDLRKWMEKADVFIVDNTSGDMELIEEAQRLRVICDHLGIRSKDG